MFWTDWGRIPKIERAALDGSNRIVIAMLNHTWPNGITVDTESDKLYWLDGYGKALFYSDLDGRHLNRVHLRPESSPMGIAVLADHIYWTDMSSNTLESLHKETFNDHKVNLRWLNHPLGIEAYKKPNFNGNQVFTFSTVCIKDKIFKFILTVFFLIYSVQSL